MRRHPRRVRRRPLSGSLPWRRGRPAHAGGGGRPRGRAGAPARHLACGPRASPHCHRRGGDGARPIRRRAGRAETRADRRGGERGGPPGDGHRVETPEEGPADGVRAGVGGERPRRHRAVIWVQHGSVLHRRVARPRPTSCPLNAPGRGRRSARAVRRVARPACRHSRAGRCGADPRNPLRPGESGRSADGGWATSGAGGRCGGALRGRGRKHSSPLSRASRGRRRESAAGAFRPVPRPPTLAG